MDRARKKPRGGGEATPDAPTAAASRRKKDREIASRARLTYVGDGGDCMHLPGGYDAPEDTRHEHPAKKEIKNAELAEARGARRTSTAMDDQLTFAAGKIIK